FASAIRDQPLLLLPCALLTGDGLACAALLSCVRPGPLAMDGEIPPVALAAVAVDLDQPGDVLPHFAAQVAFDNEVLVDVFADANDLVVGQVPHFSVGIDAGFSENLLRPREADAIDIGERDFDALVVWKVDPGNSCHSLPLALLVLWNFANNHHAAVPANHLALVAAWLN